MKNVHLNRRFFDQIAVMFGREARKPDAWVHPVFVVRSMGAAGADPAPSGSKRTGVTVNLAPGSLVLPAVARHALWSVPLAGQAVVAGPSYLCTVSDTGVAGLMLATLAGSAA